MEGLAQLVPRVAVLAVEERGEVAVEAEVRHHFQVHDGAVPWHGLLVALLHICNFLVVVAEADALLVERERRASLVFADEDEHAGEEGERGVDQIVRVADPAYRRVGVESGHDGVEVLALRVDGGTKAAVVALVVERREVGILRHSRQTHCHHHQAGGNMIQVCHGLFGLLSCLLASSGPDDVRLQSYAFPCDEALPFASYIFLYVARKVNVGKTVWKKVTAYKESDYFHRILAFSEYRLVFPVVNINIMKLIRDIRYKCHFNEGYEPMEDMYEYSVLELV